MPNIPLKYFAKFLGDQMTAMNLIPTGYRNNIPC